MAITSADDASIALANAGGTDGFDAWSADRDSTYYNGSNGYVSSEMVGAVELANYGAWENYVPYGNVWFQSSVAVNWAPYRYGQWGWIEPWGWTWIDDAPGGYAPFH